MKSFLNRFSSFELIVIALVASVGVAVKPIIVSLVHLLTGPLLIPGGSIAGGFYMMFIIIGAGLVGKRGSATLICLIQALLVIITGIYGTHGIASIITYLVPGIMVDLVWMIIRHKGCCLLCCFIGGITANVTGALLVNLVFFRLPLIPLLLSCALATFSWGLGGIIAYNVIKNVQTHMKPERIDGGE